MTAIVLAVASIGVAAFGPDHAEVENAPKAGASLSFEPSTP